MKFYYNGQLVRTSNHDYKYALIGKSGKAIMCSEKADGCQKQINAFVSQAKERIENCNRELKAITQGKSTYLFKDGRHEYRVEVGSALDDLKEQIAFSENYINNINNIYKIVELERR